MNGTWWLKESDLDLDQIRIYNHKKDKSYLILGPPGSGKTNILLLRAKFLKLSKTYNIVMIVFNNTLKDFLQSGRNEYEIENLEIITIQKLIWDILRENEIEPEKNGDFEENRIANAKLLEELIKTKKLRNIYDVILIDEAQDLLPIEIKLIKKITNFIYAVADSRQKIYNGEDPIDELKSGVDCEELLFHYRNGKKICKLADGIAKHTDDYQDLESTSQYDEASNPSIVNIFKCDDSNEQLKKIENLLDLQIKTYPGEFIGILCPTNEEMSTISEYFFNSNFKDKIVFPYEESISFNKERPIIICNIHRSKGLEFRAVHIAFLDSIKKFKQKNRNLTYTAVTRAKTSLSIYHCGNLFPYFEQACEELDPSPYTPTSEDIFNKKKK
jgi:superfamily I DNA/RNA helicase